MSRKSLETIDNVAKSLGLTMETDLDAIRSEVLGIFIKINFLMLGILALHFVANGKWSFFSSMGVRLSSPDVNAIYVVANIAVWGLVAVGLGVSFKGFCRALFKSAYIRLRAEHGCEEAKDRTKVFFLTGSNSPLSKKLKRLSLWGELFLTFLPMMILGFITFILLNVLVNLEYQSCDTTNEPNTASIENELKVEQCPIKRVNFREFIDKIPNGSILKELVAK